MTIIWLNAEVMGLERGGRRGMEPTPATDSSTPQKECIQGLCPKELRLIPQLENAFELLHHLGVIHVFMLDRNHGFRAGAGKVTAPVIHDAI
jgi:hypothetical protein